MPINSQPKVCNPKSKNTLWLAFIAVTLIAAFFRFYRLADHPLGLFFDPAINGLDAIRLMQRGGPALFFPTNGGREALLIYLLTPFLWLFGTTPFSFRLQLALISLLNVVFLFAFLSDSHLTTYLQPQNGKNTKNSLHNSQFTIWFSALAGLSLAVSYWHISISRLDQRPLTVPLLSVPVFWFFLKGWTSGQRRWFVLSGLAMGLGFHAYSAARLLPVILILALLPELLQFRPRFRFDVSPITHHLSGLILFIGATLLVAAPMFWYFATHPAQFTARAASVMVWHYLDTPADILAELGRNTWRVLGFFCCTGSPNAIFGLPDYPGLSPLLAPFLVIGLFIAIKNWRSLFWRLIALWWLIGISPSIIAIEAPHPLRLIVAIVPTAILVALGLQVAGSKVADNFTSHISRLASLLPFVLVLATIPATFSAYFVQWPKLQVTQGIYDYGAIAIRDTVLKHANIVRPIYLPLARFNDAPLLYYLSGVYRRQAMLSVPSAASALVISPEENEQTTVWVRLWGDTATILPPLTAAGQELLQTALSKNDTQTIRTTSGETAARLAVLATDPAHRVQAITNPVNATFGPAHLLGATYPTTIIPGSGKLPVTLFWQATAQMVDEYEVLLQLVDDQRRVWGDGTARPNDWAYPTTFWRPGLDTIAAQQTVTLTSNTLLPGRYWLAVSVYHPALAQRLPLTEGAGDSPDTIFIGPLKVPLPPPSSEGGGQAEIVTFGNIAKLLAAKIEKPQLTAGEPVQVSLLWEALEPAPADYTVFVHLLDPENKLIAGNDSQPLNNSYPTTLWGRGERILDPHTLPTPNSLSPGQYRLAIGLYYQPTGERLPLYYPDGRQNVQGILILEQLITVTNDR